MARTQTLFESAVARARVVRQGELTQMIIDGGGALVMETMEFNAAAKWAQSKPATGNSLTDRGRLLERITVLISRPGSVLSTRGSDKQVANLARLMRQGGYDLGEWQLPPELKNMKPGGLPADEPKKDKDTKGDANPEGTVPSPPGGARGSG